MKKTFKKFMLVFSLLSIVVWSSGASALATKPVDNDEKITICHFPPGNTENSQTIEIAKSAWSTHEAHGDNVGSCPPPPPPPPVEVVHGEWCSALIGVMGSATLRTNNVVDVDDNGNILDLTDVSTASSWYGAGDNTACRASFGPEGEFTEDNYLNIDWCAGLLQGIRDTIGTKTGDAGFSEIFDLNHDGSINLSDVAMVATLVNNADQAACYPYYVPPMPSWEPEAPETVTIKAHKIVCDSETDLPNMSNGADITATTAQTIVDNSNGKCHFQTDWQFQWGTNDSLLQLPGNFVGKHVASGWNDFSSMTGNTAAPSEVTINMSDVPTDNKLWFREVLKEKYVPFSFPSVEYPSAPGSDVSAEFWCNQDVLNYDNAEWINVSADNTYYCVAINALKTAEPEIIHGEWCSALIGVMSSVTLKNNNVIDVNDDSALGDLTDVSVATSWYGAGDNTACREAFGPDGEFTEDNYLNIDWCAGLLQGVTDTIGTKTGDAGFSEIFDLNHDGFINLSDVALVATLVNNADQSACYPYYVPPMPEWSTPPVEPSCGNGIVEAGEQCDSFGLFDCTTEAGYAGTRTCNMPPVKTLTLQSVEPTYCVFNTCNTIEYCGDETVNGTEECDAGSEGSDICSSECTNIINPPQPICGNGQIEANEVCDDGNLNTEMCGDNTTQNGTYCNATCTATMTLAEACDAGTSGSQSCTAQCTVIETPRRGGGGGGSYAQLSIFNVLAQTATSSALVTWNTTRSSLTWILYGTSSSYGQEVKTTAYATNHGVNLENLLPNTLYHYQLRAVDSNTNTFNDIDRTFTTNGSGIPQQVLGEKISACIPDIDGDIKYVSQFTEGVLLRGCGPEVYHIVNGKKFWIPNWQYLHDNYFALRIYNISDENLVQFPYANKDNISLKKLLSKVLGTKTYADGSLLRGPDKKVYVIIKGAKVQIMSLEDLKKYAGRKIIDVSQEVLNQY